MGLMEVVSFLFNVTLLWFQAFIAVIFPPARKSLDGQVVLITGAGHGIGRELALEITRAAPRAKLVLWDLNKENNDATASQVKELGGEAYSYACDVSKSSEIHSVAQKVRQDVGEVDVLINNAGILYGGALLDMEEKHIRRTFEVNTLAHFWTAREFLPAMMEKNRGHIVNIASMSAKGGTAFLVDYSASKHAVYGMTEALGEEMRKLGKPGVKTTVVCPMFVNTGLCMFPNDRFGKVLTPEEVATATVDGMLRNEEYVFVPRPLWFSLRITGLLPVRVNQYIKEFGEIGIEPQYQHMKKD
ncbi:estradiol 17-beta-dehydrogenase 11-like [Littorina saxatilis]|uniref:estradiol 17-beta-dehydrogenase 11-like n=1 Tax=Littorina saxatilis TaxID=31220 RepID=UPI0038B51FE6